MSGSQTTVSADAPVRNPVGFTTPRVEALRDGVLEGHLLESRAFWRSYERAMSPQRRPSLPLLGGCLCCCRCGVAAQ